MSKPGPETKLIKKMRDEAKKIYGGRLVTVKYHGSQFGEAGVSDLLCCLDGKFGACEVKAPESYGGSVEKALAEGPTLKQKAFVARVDVAGGYGWFAATVEQFLAGLEEMEGMDL
jgi:hypothetical protein